MALNDGLKFGGLREWVGRVGGGSGTIAVGVIGIRRITTNI